VFALVTMLPALPALATAGLAEWTIVTPGGHLISHTDGWKETYGDCLRDDDGETVFVSHLKRWRYYTERVIGEADVGYFVFDEKTERVERFARERELLDAAREFGNPRSPWLRGGDGWLEAWFPFVVWEPCRRGQRSLGNVECSAADDAALLERYRLTTWGRYCRQMRAGDRFEPVLTDFCEMLLAP
jgi:hypothetical protein